MQALCLKATITAAMTALSLAAPLAAQAGGTDAAVAAESVVDWQAQPVRLLMVERAGCIYCQTWHREIGPGYPKSSEGRAAPLLTVDLDGPWPDGLALDRRAVVTPTFVLLRNGDEVSRLEGYPGDQYFYPLIARMLQDAETDRDRQEVGG